jgi:hypothetical protein
MAKVYKDVVSPEDIVSLKNYFDQEDDRSDHRPTMSSKHPRWNIDQWPQQTVTNIINKLVDFNWAVDELVMFHQRSYNQKVHTDSHREWPSDWLGPAFLFPLEFTPRASTVFFDNYWAGTTGKFSRSAVKQSIDQGSGALGLGQNTITDYSQIVNINNQHFDEKIYYEYLSYLPIEDLHGLSVEQIVNWNLGDVLSWDRTQLHCSSNQHHHKKYLTVFTYNVDKAQFNHI